jgi:hypothetical protein
MKLHEGESKKSPFGANLSVNFFHKLPNSWDECARVPFVIPSWPSKLVAYACPGCFRTPNSQSSAKLSLYSQFPRVMCPNRQFIVSFSVSSKVENSI